MQEVKESICQMCQNFYRLGWVSGTGGGISIKRDQKIFMAPSGVEKEKIKPEDIFTIDMEGNIIESPASATLKLSECAPLFLAAYNLKGTGAVIHSHSINVMLATKLAVPYTNGFSVLEWTELEMLKGIGDFGYYDTFTLPVIENTARECDLTSRLKEAILAFPRTPAVAVHNHGIYVWGRDEKKAKTQAECIDYICQAKLMMRQYHLEAVETI